ATGVQGPVRAGARGEGQLQRIDGIVRGGAAHGARLTEGRIRLLGEQQLRDLRPKVGRREGRTSVGVHRVDLGPGIERLGRAREVAGLAGSQEVFVRTGEGLEGEETQGGQQEECQEFSHVEAYWTYQTKPSR